MESRAFFAEGLNVLPLYPYRCTQCGHRFEKIQHFKDEPEKTCPECGGALERILTAPGLSFKGAGWYVNDYASKGGSSSSESDSKAEKSRAESKPDAKSEKKSETKSEPKAASTDSSSATPAVSAPAATPKPNKSS